MYYTPKEIENIVDTASGSGSFLKSADDAILTNPPYAVKKMKEYYWQDILNGLVTKTTTPRKPSRLHKRITKAAYEKAKASR